MNSVKWASQQRDNLYIKTESSASCSGSLRKKTEGSEELNVEVPEGGKRRQGEKEEIANKDLPSVRGKPMNCRQPKSARQFSIFRLFILTP